MMTRRVGAGKQAGSARCAITSSSISCGENHSLFCKLVEVRRFVEIATLIADVFPTEIVCEDENDIGLRPYVGGMNRCP